jgi:hypothetical protein
MDVYEDKQIPAHLAQCCNNVSHAFPLTSSTLLRWLPSTQVGDGTALADRLGLGEFPDKQKAKQLYRRL